VLTNDRGRHSSHRKDLSGSGLVEDPSVLILGISMRSGAHSTFSLVLIEDRKHVRVEYSR